MRERQRETERDIERQRETEREIETETNESYKSIPSGLAECYRTAGTRMQFYCTQSVIKQTYDFKFYWLRTLKKEFS